MWIGSSMSGIRWRHGMPKCSPNSFQVGSPAWMNQWWHGKIILVQAGYFYPGSPISLGMSITPYAVTCQWWYFCQSCGGGIFTKIERESVVQGGLWRNWGDDDADEKSTFWHIEDCGYVQCLLCAEGYSRDVSKWAIWDDGDKEKYILSQVLQVIFHWGMLPIQGGWGCLWCLWWYVFTQVKYKVYEVGWLCHETLQHSWLAV